MVMWSCFILYVMFSANQFNLGLEGSFLMGGFVGGKVVMIPNIPYEDDDVILENYRTSSKFRSSNCDGFLMDYVNLTPDRLIKVPEDFNLKIASFTELISVSVHASKRFINFSHDNRGTIGVWGDGIFGYITALVVTF